MIRLKIDNIVITDYKYGYQVQEEKARAEGKDKGELYLAEARFFPNLSWAVRYASKIIRTDNEEDITTLSEMIAENDRFIGILESAIKELNK